MHLGFAFFEPVQLLELPGLDFVHFFEPVQVVRLKPSKNVKQQLLFCSFLKTTLQITVFSTLTKLHLKTLSVFVFVAVSNPVLHQVQKAHLRQYQKMHKSTVNYSVFCKASANQVDTEHLQINIFHAKSRKVGPGGGVTMYIYIYIYIIHTYIRVHVLYSSPKQVDQLLASC